jgi:hypothetical protein
MPRLLIALAAAGLMVGGAQAKSHHTAVAGCSDAAHYSNVSGHCVHRPMHAASRPAGASARCGDGSYSFSEHRRGTCSHHGGVATWY